MEAPQILSRGHSELLKGLSTTQEAVRMINIAAATFLDVSNTFDRV